LIHGFWRIWFRKRCYSLLIVGLDNAGKTTCLEQWKAMYLKRKPGAKLPNIVPTVGLNIAQFDAMDHKLTIWDLGGQGGLRVIWDKYFKGANAIIYVLDASDSARLIEAKRELRMFKN
jgi:ADP-ribosylation factor related protein 1